MCSSRAPCITGTLVCSISKCSFIKIFSPYDREKKLEVENSGVKYHVLCPNIHSLITILYHLICLPLWGRFKYGIWFCNITSFKIFIRSLYLIVTEEYFLFFRQGKLISDKIFHFTRRISNSLKFIRLSTIQTYAGIFTTFVLELVIPLKVTVKHQ